MTSTAPRIVVAGASGALGRVVCRAVLDLIPGADLVVGDRREERGARTAQSVGARSAVRLDTDDPDSVRIALAGASLVIVTQPQDEPVLQRGSLAAGAHCVDVTTDPALTAQVRPLDAPARAAGLASVAMAGLFPGLSGLLAAHVAGQLDQVERVWVGLRQSANAEVGRTGIVEMLHLLAAPVPAGSGRVPRHVLGGVRMRPIAYPEGTILGEHLNVVGEHMGALGGHPAGPAATPAVRYATGWDAPALIWVVGALARLRLLRPLTPALARLVRYDPGQPQDVELEVRALGRTGDRTTVRSAHLAADSDYGATAVAAAAIGALALDGAVRGAGVPMELMSWGDLLPRLDHDVVRVTAGAARR